MSGDNITTFSPSTQPLAAIRDNVVLIEGLSSGSPAKVTAARRDRRRSGYQYTSMATSVDQFIADKLRR